jgi:hypothetical protein
MDPMTERVDPAAAAVLIRDLDGRELPLRETWNRRTAVLVFVRHFG